MSLSFWQIVIIVVIVLLLFIMPQRISGLGKSLGEALRDFRKALKDGGEKESKKAEEKQTEEKKED